MQFRALCISNGTGWWGWWQSIPHYDDTMVGFEKWLFKCSPFSMQDWKGRGQWPKRTLHRKYMKRTFCACVFFSKISPWLSLAKNESFHTNCTSHLICKVKLGQILHDLPSRHLPLKGDMPSSTDLPPGHDTGGEEGTRECPPWLQIWQRIWAEFIIIL